MKKVELIKKISRELLENDMLDINNYSGNTDKLLKDVEKIITDNLADYVMVTGSVLE